MRIVSYSRSPVAGVAAMLARAIDARTPHRARCVWAKCDYGNGISFRGDVEYERDPRTAIELLEAADVVIVHNGKIAPEHEGIIGGKPVITLAHNYRWNVDLRAVERGFPALVVAQYQATLPEFAGWTPVPNPIPLWEPEHQPEEKPLPVGICYTPSMRHERRAADDPLYWHSKGYDTTMRVLESLAARVPLRLEVVREQRVSHAESLAMKRRSHIVIDECVTGSYHRNSLEGLAAGCVVINGIGLLPGVEELLRSVTGEEAETPFVPATLETLESVLAALLARGDLAGLGLRNRAWLERWWDFGEQWPRFWQPAVDRALERASELRRRYRPVPIERVAVTHPPIDDLTVIVEIEGETQLRNLRVTLQWLRDAGAVHGIVVERNPEPYARALAEAVGYRYVFNEEAPAIEDAMCIPVGVLVTRGMLEERTVPAMSMLNRAESDAVAAGVRSPSAPVRLWSAPTVD